MSVESKNPVQCVHDFQIVEKAEDGTLTLVCRKPGCNFCKKTNPPVEAKKEKTDKKMLLE